MYRKVIFINFTFFILFLFIIEIFFGYWFSQYNFGYHMRNKRMIEHKISSEFNNHKYEFIYKRNFFGFRMEKDVSPHNIDIIFEGGSTADEFPLPEHLTIVGNLNSFLEKDKIDLFIANAAVGGKSTAGYLNDFQNWFPRLKGFKPKIAIFLSGINDSAFLAYINSINNNLKIEDNTYENKIHKKIISYISNNSFFLIKIKIIKDKYFDLEKEKIKYDVNKKNLYLDYNVVTFEQAVKKFTNTKVNAKEQLVLSYYKSNLMKLRKEIIKNQIYPVFITQTMYDGLSSKMLYLINQETKRFCLKYNYKIIMLDEIFTPSVGDFYDTIHTTPQGSLKIANYIYKALKGTFYKYSQNY